MSGQRKFGVFGWKMLGTNPANPIDDKRLNVLSDLKALRRFVLRLDETSTSPHFEPQQFPISRRLAGSGSFTQVTLLLDVCTSG